MGSTGRPFTRTPKWRCGPVELPVEPDAAMAWPRWTSCPTPTKICERWQYCVASRPPWATLTLLPLFIGGAWLLMRVDLDRGAKEAAAIDAAGA